MLKHLSIFLLIVITSCSVGSSNPDKSQAANTGDKEIPSPNIQGQWDIENVVENDSSYVRPSETEEGMTAYIDFREDNTFGIVTNCNSLGGQYLLHNDTIQLKDIFTTEIACDNMQLEDMLKKVLPMINTVDCLNDSITRLNSSIGESYIVLKKRELPVK